LLLINHFIYQTIRIMSLKTFHRWRNWKYSTDGAKCVTDLRILSRK